MLQFMSVIARPDEVMNIQSEHILIIMLWHIHLLHAGIKFLFTSFPSPSTPPSSLIMPYDKPFSLRLLYILISISPFPLSYIPFLLVQNLFLMCIVPNVSHSIKIKSECLQMKKITTLILFYRIVRSFWGERFSWNLHVLYMCSLHTYLMSS